MIVEQTEILEIDINPLLVSSQSMIALDARIRASAVERIEHQALCALGDSTVSIRVFEEVQLSDGTNVRLRPIRPEDEPAWRAMLGRCSKETLWSRFHMLFKEATHEMATRFCFLDYDREMRWWPSRWTKRTRLMDPHLARSLAWGRLAAMSIIELPRVCDFLSKTNGQIRGWESSWQNIRWRLPNLGAFKR